MLIQYRERNGDFWKVSEQFNPIGVGGHNVPALFSEGYFSMKKGVCRSEIHYKLSDDQRFLVFHSHLRGAGTLCPHTQASFKNPTLLGLMIHLREVDFIATY